MNVSTEVAARSRRSFLFVPGTGLEMFPKALAARPDIICIDLEDAIAPPDKASARAATLELFNHLPDNPGDCELLVRVNSLRTADGLADLLAVVNSDTPPPGLMLPKIKSPDEVRLLDEILDSIDAEMRLQLIIETNEGLEACHEIARASE